MDRILQDCMRATLAEHATYAYARGGNDISGPSIRLAETIARRWGNLEAGVKELTRRDGVSECMSYAWDLETNYREVKSFTVRHWRDTKLGGYALTDERDIYEAIANVGARRKRACILAVIDGDVIEAAVKQCENTLKTNVEVTPTTLAAMVEKFGEYGVTKEHIEQRIQRRLDAITPAQVVQLRRIYNSLRDGMSEPREWFDSPAVSTSAEGNDAAGAAAGGSRTERVKQRMRRTPSASKTQSTPATPTASDAAPADAANAADVPSMAQSELPGVQTDADTGEMIASYAEVRAALEAARTRDDLDTAGDLIRYVRVEAQRAELSEIFRARVADFDAR
jgi:hypothetical protein